MSPSLFYCTTFLIFASLVHVASLVWKRLFSRRLRHIPGPMLAALTTYYAAYYDIIKDGGWVEHLEELHKGYGPVVRVGPNELHFNDLQAYEDIYAIDSKLTKDPDFYKCFHEDESSFGYTDHRDARTRREVLRPLFSRRAIRRLEGVIQENVNKLIARLLFFEHDKTPVDLHLAFRCVSLDIITTYCFAQCYGALDAPGFRHPFLLALDTEQPLCWIFRHFPFVFHVLNYLPMFFADSDFAIVMQKLSDQIDELLANVTVLDQLENETIYHHLLKIQPSKGIFNVPSQKSLLEEACALIAAGGDTTGNACTVATFFILRDPVIYRRLMAELESAWPDEDTIITYENVQKLPYLTAVIREALRVANGVVSPLRRVVGPEGSIIANIEVPPQVTVSMGQTFVHFNPNIFHHPHEFDPSRWLTGNTRNLLKYLVPFSRGPRKCIGMNLAWCEMYLILANVFRKVPLELHQTTIEDMKFRDYFMPLYRGRHLHAIVTQRLS